MRKLFLILIISFLGLPLLGQNQGYNIEKYWRYRDRLRKRFIVVNENVEQFGVNIPAVEIDYDNGVISWGDANSNMSHYLSVLATELWLLKHNNQDYSPTLKELYYAMLAMERLDTYSESSLRIKINRPAYCYMYGNSKICSYFAEEDINGFHIRDDISSGFWNNYKSHFDVPNFNSVFNNRDMEEISQDNIFHNMEGLALVAKLVGVESVSGIPITFINSVIPDRLTELGIQNGSNINFSLWAQDFVKRYIRYMQCDGTYSISCLGIGVITHWILGNPVIGGLVREGSGRDLDLCAFYHHGVIKSGEAITGQNLRIYNGLSNPPDRFFNDLFRKHSVEINYPDPVVDWIIDKVFGGIWVNISFDDYKVRSLACNSNALGNETFSVLRQHRDNYSPYIYEHLPLMYLTLHDPSYQIMAIEDDVYNTDKDYYENLLNSAPECGSSSNGVYNWSSTSRCVWPESLGANSTRNIEYSGLDYMMLHNLYYIAFRKEDYVNLTINSSSIFRWVSVNAGIINAKSSVSGYNVTYTASNCINLEPDFSVSGGKNFEARISPRPNNYQGGLYRTIPVFDCKSSLMSVKAYHDTIIQQNAVLEFIEPPKIERKPKIEKQPISFPSEEVSISIFPNPCNGLLNLSISNLLKPLNYDIVNVSGMVVYRGFINATIEQVDLSFLPEGVFLIRFYAKDKMHTKKLIIIH